MASEVLWAYRVPIYGFVRIYAHGNGTKTHGLGGFIGSMDYLAWRALGGPAIRENRVKMILGDLTEVRSDGE